ncbi:hypothetical protein HYE67_010197 [Fusarium culmorum]|uniref:Cytochrome P450 n=1 Tax=Fusarium culmorum TaxID=5516 RepID=A0A2T4H7Y7_FUSCU|nr:hypothetical protein FCULG_00005166 [Fusarium culmorum]QPC67966.1 hypothetical protein HYE67_010197 [Fusarium culmorum]
MVQGDIALGWAGILLLTSTSYFAIRLYQQRVWFRRMVEKHNIPTLPGHSWLLGNLIAVGKIMVAYPADVHGQLMPERWLEQDFHRTAYRPFELGPRGCIGQELALTELRLLLAIAVRDLEIVPAYEDGADKLYGYRAFQAHMPGELTAHPSKGMPVRVRLRKV